MKILRLISAAVSFALLVGAELASAQGSHSGIVGQTLLNPRCPVSAPFIDCGPPRPFETTVSVYNDKGKLVSEVTSGDDGYFVIYINPGTYTLVPKNPELPLIYPFSDPQSVVVPFKDFAPVTVLYLNNI
jgi:hypothetical protein